MFHDNVPGQDHHHARRLGSQPEKREVVELQSSYNLSAIRVDIIRMQARFDSRMQRTGRAIETKT